MSQAVMYRLLGCLLGLGPENLQELLPYVGGSSYIKRAFKDYCVLAKHEHVFILTDLDLAKCPPSLRKEWINEARLREPLPKKLCFNVASIEVESWLLADRENLGSFLGIPKNILPTGDEIADPKERLLQCVRNHGSREARAMLLPSSQKISGVGHNYNDHLSNFVANIWNYEHAAKYNASLYRAISKIKLMKHII